MIKLVLSDMDGTLLSKGASNVSYRTVRAIRTLLDVGVRFAPATGRQAFELDERFFGVRECYETAIAANGKRVYVDKTFAPDYETAKRIFDIAEKSNTPCYSTSALRYATEYQNIGEVDAIASWGPYSFDTYSIHQLEPVMMLIHAKPQSVCFVPGVHGYTLLIRFEDGRTATINGFDMHSPFMMNIALKDKCCIVNVQSDYFGGFIKNLVRFFETGEGAVPHEETLRIMAVRGAGLKAAQKPGQWVNI